MANRWPPAASSGLVLVLKCMYVNFSLRTTGELFICVIRFAWPNPVLVACHWLHSSRTGDLDTGRVVGQTGLNRSLISNLATYVDAVNSSPAGCYGANLM